MAESPTVEERETIIGWSDDDNDEVFVYSSQQPMIRKLLKNPLFKVVDKRFNKTYRCYPDPVSINGILPKRAITIRTKFRKYTPEQRKILAKQLKNSHKR